MVKESAKNGLTINCKMSETMIVCKRDSPRCKLQIGDAQIKQVQGFTNLWSVIIEDWKYDTATKKRKRCIPKTKEILRNKKKLWLNIALIMCSKKPLYTTNAILSSKAFTTESIYLLKNVRACIVSRDSQTFKWINFVTEAVYLMRVLCKQGNNNI